MSSQNKNRNFQFIILLYIIFLICLKFVKAQGVSQYDDDFPSSASGSANEQSPSKVIDKSEHHSKVQTSELESLQNQQSENESEEIDEEIPSSISGVSYNKLLINKLIT